jgi:hypothetical protein
VNNNEQSGNMNSATTTTEPPATPAQDSPWQLIYCRQRMPDFPHVVPAGNCIGTFLMTRLIRARFELAGLRVGCCEGSGFLNQSIFIAQVNDAARAFSALRELFAELPFHTITSLEMGLYDPREQIIRLQPPHAPASRLFPDAEIAAFAEQFRQFATNMQAALLSQLPPDSEANPS